MKDPMRHPTPTAPELGTHDGLAYALFLPPPERDADVGVVILHGAGSAKESHFDFARGCRADGMAALAYDARGHGRSEGTSGRRPSTTRWRWRTSSARTHRASLSAAPAWAGSRRSMRQRRSDAISAVVAICPAPEDGLARFLRSGQELHFRCDREATGPWLESLDIYSAAASLGPETALLLMHARGDEQVPYEISERLYEVAEEPKRLLLMPGGHHRSIQHDEELQAVSRRFIRDAADSFENHSR